MSMAIDISFSFILLLLFLVTLTRSSFVYLLHVTVVFPVFFLRNYQQYDSRFPLKCNFFSLPSLSPPLFAIINCIAAFFFISFRAVFLSPLSLSLSLLLFFFSLQFDKIFSGSPNVAMREAVLFGIVDKETKKKSRA